MTNGFSEDRELGRGSYGKVYLVWKTKVLSGREIGFKSLFYSIREGDAATLVISDTLHIIWSANCYWNRFMYYFRENVITLCTIEQCSKNRYP
jgi:hypothetical protein